MKTLFLENSILAKTKTYLKEVDSYGTIDLVSKAHDKLSKKEDALWSPDHEIADSTAELLFDHEEGVSCIVESEGAISHAEVSGSISCFCKATEVTEVMMKLRMPTDMEFFTLHDSLITQQTRFERENALTFSPPYA